MRQFEKCEKCGGDIEYRQIDSVQGLFCKSCNWSLVTTCVPELDETIYYVCVLNADYKNLKHISAIASAFGKRYLYVRKLLQQENPLIIPEFNYF